MDTVLVQSFHDRPPRWIERCLGSTRAFAQEAGIAYRFVGDTLFDPLPEWILRKTRGRVQVASDLARLILIRDLLVEGWRKAVWLDADVFVFDPARMMAALELPEGYGFGREAWVQYDAKGRLKAWRGVHNAFTGFAAGNAFLPYYIEAAERILARHDGAMVPQLIGPKLLTALDNMISLPAYWYVNMTSPLVSAGLAAGSSQALDVFRARSGGIPAAVNLCQSYAGRESDGVHLDDAMMNQVIDRLQKEGAAIFSVPD